MTRPPRSGTRASDRADSAVACVYSLFLNPRAALRTRLLRRPVAVSIPAPSVETQLQRLPGAAFIEGSRSGGGRGGKGTSDQSTVKSGSPGMPHESRPSSRSQRLPERIPTVMPKHSSTRVRRVNVSHRLLPSPPTQGSSDRRHETQGVQAIYNTSR